MEGWANAPHQAAFVILLDRPYFLKQNGGRDHYKRNYLIGIFLSNKEGLAL